MTQGSAGDDRLTDLGRRMLAGEPIDWDKEGIAESEVREGLQRLQKVIGTPDGTATAVQAAPPARASAIGPFRLVRKLGEGGMGVVYEAEQQHPHRGVALKVIRGGRHVDDHTLRLFQREIHTLARLNHPGIAQLYETGVTDDGMHYFAMELVRGVPLSEWLKRRSGHTVTPTELRIRVGLFRKICDAVAYAHQKGVIHRDLKPANILVPVAQAGSSIQDAVPEIKILDFGLARMTDTDVQMTTFHTEMGKVQGTLPYMSPEQIRGNPDEIDLRTDVYSLGVILYELVTGHLPLDVSKAQLGEAMRIICEDTPRSLSTTFQGTRRLDADIATIAGKCLEKESARRYQSAAVLAEDVQRYLSDQPIQARPPSAAYQFRKLVRRHKGPFAVAAGVFVLLVAFSVAMSVAAMRIARERDRANVQAQTAEQVSEFVEGIFKSSDPTAAPQDVTPLQLLDSAAEQIESKLKDQPAVQARLLRLIGKAYRGLAYPEQGDPMVERGVRLTEKVYGHESLEYAAALLDRNGLEACTEAHRIYERLLPPGDPRLLRSFTYMATAQGGEENLRRALALAEGENDLEVQLWITNNLSLLLAQTGRFEEAIPLSRRAVDLAQRIFGPGNYYHLAAMNLLGCNLGIVGRAEEGRPILESALRLSEQRLGPDHTLTGYILQSLGDLERRDGHLELARTLLERSIRTFDKRSPPSSAVYIDSLTPLGRLAEAEGRLDEAIQHLRRAHEIYRQDPGTTLEDPAPDLERVLRKASRTAEADELRASMKGAQAP